MIQQLADWLTYDLLGLDATSHPPWHRHCLHDGHRGVVATRSHTTQEGYDMAPHWCVFWHLHTVHHLTGLSFQLRLMRVFARGTGISRLYLRNTGTPKEGDR